MPQLDSVMTLLCLILTDTKDYKISITSWKEMFHDSVWISDLSFNIKIDLTYRCFGCMHASCNNACGNENKYVRILYVLYDILMFIGLTVKSLMMKHTVNV